MSQWQTSWKAHKVHKTNPVKRRVEDLVHIAALDVRDCMLCVCVELGFDLHTDPLDGRLDYPATRAHTKANVNQMRRAEKGLDKFWSELDLDLRAATGRGIIAMMKSRMNEPREKHRTPPWKEPVKPTQSTPKAKAVLEELNTNVTISQAPSSAKADVSLPTPKNKIKTRGVPSSPAVPQPAPRTPTPDIDDHSVRDTDFIKVSKRAFKALDALLPAPTSSSHQRAEVAWNELLAAMDEIGLQPEKLYGSVWVFKPGGDGKCKVDVTRSISFHEPKEVRHGHKIPTNMVRTFGRRLKHAYGWRDGMFVCV